MNGADETRVEIPDDLKTALEAWDVAQTNFELTRETPDGWEAASQLFAARSRVLEIYRSLEAAR